MRRAEQALPRIRAAPIWAALMLAFGFFAAPVARAQTYATGAILTTEAEAAQLPEAAGARGFLPLSVDLGPRFPPVGDQGPIGSCVAFAVGHAALGYLMNEGAGTRLPRADLPSPGYLYGLATRRSLAFHEGDCVGGSNIRTTMQILASGSALEREYPYSRRECPRPPDEIVAKVEARRSPALTNHAVITFKRREGPEAFLDAIKQELARGYPVVTGLNLNPMFFDLEDRIWDGTGNLDRTVGHAITLTGYDEVTRSFSFVNSWGTDWGNRGFGRLSYETLLAQRAILDTMRVAGITPRPADPAFPPEVIGLEIPALECSSLQLSDGAISGYVASTSDLETLRRAIGDRALALDVAVRPWPQCEVLETLAAQLNQPLSPQVAAADPTFAAGDTLALSATTSGYDGFLHLAYFQADGSLVNLSQSDPLRLQMLEAGTRLVFGDGQEGRARFVVQPPFGREMVLAIQSASPLFPDPRPQIEDTRNFLTALRAVMLAQPFADRRPRVVTAATFFLETRETR